MKDTFSERLKDLRGSSSQAAFAMQIGIKQTTLSAYERGKIEPSASNILLICKTCNISADWLLGLSPTRAPTTGGGPSVNAGSGAAVNIGSGSATAGGDCSKCRLMADHIRQITGRA